MFRTAFAALGALLATILLLAAAPARADPVTDVIGAQLDAFAARDAERAFGYASPMIQGMFGDARNFGRMVEQGYPMIWSPRAPRFGDRRELGGRVYQRVLLEDAAGVMRVMEYEMVQVEGAWRINGVREVPAPDVAV